MKTRIIKQSVFFKATPYEVYEALMDSKKHSHFTGAKAKVSRKAGGKFSIFGGGLHGKNISLTKDKRVMQKWACKMKGWPEGHFSRATFSLRKVKGGTKLMFTQTGVPSVCHKEISDGWRKYYWNAMKSKFGW